MVEVTQAEYHRIDAFRVISNQAKSDASYGALAKAVSEFVANEVSLALAAKDAENAELVALLRECSDNVTVCSLMTRIDIALAKHGGCDE